MTMNRISARQRGMLEVELSRAAGYRATAVAAVLGLVAMIGLGGLQAESGAGGMHTETYGVGSEAPASLEDAFRRETVAVAPATGIYEEPELTVNHQVHG